MQEEIKTTPEQDYIDTINQMKDTMVDKAEYDKLREDNRKLLNSLMNSSKVGGEDIPQLDKSEVYLKNYKESDKMNNLQFVSNMLNLRDAILQEQGRDIFTMADQNGNVADDQKASAERTADVLKQICEDAEGDKDAFRYLYSKRIVDPAGIRVPNKKR